MTKVNAVTGATGRRERARAIELSGIQRLIVTRNTAHAHATAHARRRSASGRDLSLRSGYLESLHWLRAANAVFLSSSHHGTQNMKTHPNTSLGLASLVGLGLASSGIMAPSISFAQQYEGSTVVTPEVEVTAYRLPTLLSH